MVLGIIKNKVGNKLVVGNNNNLVVTCNGSGSTQFYINNPTHFAFYLNDISYQQLFVDDDKNTANDVLEKLLECQS